MLTIRLSRIGKKNKPIYRLIISEKTQDPYGRALEILGSYNPYTKDLQVKGERIKHWLSQGSGMSDTVNNLLVEKGIIKGEKVKASKSRQKKKGGDDSAASAESPQKAGQEDKPQGVEKAEKTEGKSEEKAEDGKKEENKDQPAEKSEEKKTEDKGEAK